MGSSTKETKVPLCVCPPTCACTIQLARKNAVPIFLISGTLAVIIGRAVYMLEAPGIHGDVHKFEKPWFVDWGMFVGMSVCLLLFQIERIVDKMKNRKPEPVSPKLYWAIAIPAACDMISTFMMNVGLLWILPSIWQMLRGSIIIFTAFLKVFYRKNRLLASEWFGMLIVVLALAVVGATTFFNQGGADVDSSASFSSSLAGQSNSLKMALGIGLVVFSQLLQALQTIIEEKLLHDVSAPAMLIVGMEGIWGMVLCTFIAMPIAYFLPGDEGKGIHEDTLDSFVMCYNSPVILALNLAYVFFILIFNLYGMIITEVTDAMMRNLLEPIRVLFIWVVGIFVHYVITKKLGEELTYWSFMELGGFVILCFGFFIYNSVIKLPCFNYDQPKEKEPLLAEQSEEGTIQQTQ